MRTWDKSKPPRGRFTLNADCAQAQGLVAWYPMGGAGGVFVPDFVGGNNLTTGMSGVHNLGKTGAPEESFTAASSQYSEGVYIGASALPLTLAGWCSDTTSGTARVVLCVGTNGANTRVQVVTDTAAHIGAQSVDAAGTTAVGYSAATYSNGVEFHYAAVFASATSRVAYLGGAAGTVQTTSIPTSGFNRILIGARRNNVGVGAYWNGNSAECGVWAQADTAAMILLRADFGRRFELWYPLRSKKWISMASATAALTGTATSAYESDIVTGGKTIILTLTNDTWVTAGATFDAQRQNIINGLDSAQAEAGGWDAVVKALQGVAGVVRTSDTVCTITLDAQGTYSITANETITATIPATAVTAAGELVATPTFQITQGSPASIVGPLIGGHLLGNGPLVGGRLVI